MKLNSLIIFILISTALSNCQNKSTKENNCNDSLIKSYDSLFVVMAKKFEPTNINFDESIKSNQEVDAFISIVKQNDKCLEDSDAKRLNSFVITLILKQYMFHLSNYHQGYDLLSMNEGNSEYIIDKYLSIINKKNTDLEMLNSGYIVDFLNNTKTVQLDEFQEKLLNEINDTITKQEKELK